MNRRLTKGSSSLPFASQSQGQSAAGELAAWASAEMPTSYTQLGSNMDFALWEYSEIGTIGGGKSGDTEGPQCIDGASYAFAFSSDPAERGAWGHRAWQRMVMQWP
jgi:hypothetical protein